MPFVVKLMIGGWVTTFLMIGLCALNDSGELLRIHERLGHWLKTLASAGNGFREQRLKHLRGDPTRDSLVQEDSFD